MPDGELQKEVLEILEGGEIPQRVANWLIMAGVVENYGMSKKNSEALFGSEEEPGLVAEVKFWKRLNYLLIVLLLTEAAAIILK